MAWRFKARDESGSDWAGSDEGMVDACDGTGGTTTNGIGVVGSWDVHEVLAPRSCVFGVVPGEVTLGRSSFCDLPTRDGPHRCGFVSSSVKRTTPESGPGPAPWR